MSNQKLFVLVSSCLLLSGFSVCRAETVITETTVTTTTQPRLPAFALSTSGNYFVVDPITGTLVGNFDPVARLIEGRTPQSGLVILDRPSGNPVATVDSLGRIVDVSVAPASEVLVVSIDTRRRDLDRQIAESLNRGLLTAAQAGVLRAQLERIAADQSAYRLSGGSLTYRQALVVASDLNMLGQRLYPTAVVTPVISPQFVVQDKRLTMVDNITYRMMQLQRRIDDEYQAGRLSAEYVSRLKEKVDKVASLEMRYRKNGELSASKTRILFERLDQLEASLNRDVALINHQRAKIGIRVN